MDSNIKNMSKAKQRDNLIQKINHQLNSKETVIDYRTKASLKREFDGLKSGKQIKSLEKLLKKIDVFGEVVKTIKGYNERKVLKKTLSNVLSDIKSGREAYIKAYKTTVKEIKVKDNIDYLFSELRKILRECIGEDVIVQYIVDDQKFGTIYVKMKSVFVPKEFSFFWHSFSAEFMFLNKNYQQNIFEPYDYKGTIFVYPQSTTFSPYNVKQSFLDGITHCVFTPIREWAQNRHDEVKNNRSREAYTTKLNHLKKLEETYKKGVPDDMISSICNTLKIDITIELPLQEDDRKFIEAKSIQKRIKSSVL